eukprot:CAMPEP_0182424028 /NCGR_PEP_ID=MMETSP1167-20130531/10159_1 /TAXON_ID=2988 /ORGANISM="Mallomonas Sp, Strain CCMP3275" /LENGTH=206 /DNA_ID=CAMNT_0024603505 /DNA_START=80 /DNA_END=700 /DNA_ORIENTATION=-
MKSTITPSQLQEAFVWRRACKHFTAPKTPIDIKPVLESILAAPTCFGIQPFSVYVVSNPELQAKLSPVSYNQPQITEASYLLFFSASTDAKAMVERFLTANNIGDDAPLAGMLRGGIGSYDEATMTSWARAQSYIAMGFALSTLAQLRISSCPMEGFDSDGVAKLLEAGPNEKIFSVIAIGGPADPAVAFPRPRFRFPEDVMFKYL